MPDQSELAIFGGVPVRKKPFVIPSPIGRQEKDAVLAVLRVGVLSKAGRGKSVKKFESLFAKLLNAPFAVSTSSGTTALHTALCALGIGLGDEVIVPALTFISSASVVLQERARVVFADIDPKTFCLDAIDVERKITKRTRAIIVVHMYGNPANMEKICALAKKHNLFVIEDCAQAHGARYKDSYVGTLGDIGCFSFYQSKIMTCGEGGMLVMKDQGLFEKVSSIVDHGITDRLQLNYDYDQLGFNYHMTEMQAAIGCAQITRLKKFIEQRRKNVLMYKSLLGRHLTFQRTEKSSAPVAYSLAALLPTKITKKRDVFLKAVRAENVLINCLYPTSLPRTKLFKELAGTKSLCLEADSVASRVVNFYVNPGLTPSEIFDTAVAVKKVLKGMKELYG